MKSVFYTIGALIVLWLGYWYYTSSLARTLPNVRTPASVERTTWAKYATTGSWVDSFLLLQNTNPLFWQAIGLSENKDYTWALNLLGKAKNMATSHNERAIVDFNIASSRFALNRLDGVRSYTDLAKNPAYEARVRALSLQRIYLMYRKYWDVEVLRTAIEAMGIVWISEDQATLEYMKKAYALYPLPGSTLFLMQQELGSVRSKSAAEAIYQKYKLVIDAGILEMQQHAWELTEATSAMLLRAKILGELHREYAMGSRRDIEQLYKNLIQFDQEKWLTVNKQYTLVYYANFLADINDVVAAQNTIKILLEEGLDPALNEWLPKAKELSALRSMTPITDKNVQDFITFLWPIR